MGVSLVDKISCSQTDFSLSSDQILSQMPLIYKSFPACPQLWMEFLDEFLVGRELQQISCSSHSPLVSSLFIDESEYQREAMCLIKAHI